MMCLSHANALLEQSRFRQPSRLESLRDLLLCAPTSRWVCPYRSVYQSSTGKSLLMSLERFLRCHHIGVPCAPWIDLIEAVPNFSVGGDPAVIRDDRRGDRGARAGARHPLRRRSQPLSVHVRGRSRRAGGGTRRRPWRSPSSASTCARHVGVHPRVGAADVIPFVRFAPDDPAPLLAARALGALIAELGVPCFGYGELGDGRRPAFFRKGGP